jgi:hypothetical protein
MPHVSSMNEKSQPAKIGSLVVLLAAAVFFIGLGQLLVLPPFEGFDEQAHYSSIRQIAETGTFPVSARSFISPDVIEYRKHGPMPYDAPIPLESGTRTYNASDIANTSNIFGVGTITYPEFFASHDLQNDFTATYRAATPRIPYKSETPEPNWESQHPPLYYFVMAPVLRLTDRLPFVSQFFVLRVASFGLAFAGLIIGLGGTLKYGEGIPAAPYVAAGYLLAPIILPMFYPEFGRIGNDSLVIFLFGILWYFMLHWTRQPANINCAIVIGCCCGLGLLTKTSFIPLCTVLGFHVLLAMKRGHMAFFTVAHLAALGLISGLAILLSGWWYLYQAIHFGTWTGSWGLIVAHESGGLWTNLQQNFKPLDTLLIIDVILKTWSWYGTLSTVHIGALAQAPLLFFMLWIFYNYLRELKRYPLTSHAWLPAWFFIVTLAGLAFHSLVEIAITQDNLLPGWYMQVLIPAYGLALAYGLQRISRSRTKRIALAVLLGYSVCFLAAICWAQASLFAGCATRGLPIRRYIFPVGGGFCVYRRHEVMANLAVIGWPHAALAALGLGFVCLVLGLCKISRRTRDMGGDLSAPPALARSARLVGTRPGRI